MTRVGDFLVAFQDEAAPPGPGRCGTPWRVVLSSDKWRAFAQQASESWSGYPFEAVRTNDWNLWLLGELYGPTDNAARMLLNLVQKEEAAREANGHFLVFGQESPTRLWHVWTNRFGTLHAYHGWDGRRGAFGTFACGVAAIASSRKLDWLGWAGFFAFGYFPGDRTQLEDVKILRPASHYVFDEDGRLLSGERYWHWRHEGRDARPYRDTLDEFRVTLDTVMDDLTGTGRVAVPISGGLDSRTVVASATRTERLPRERVQLRAYSYGYSPDSKETEIAGRVAAARDLPFQPYVIEPYLFRKLPLVLGAVEGFQDVTQSRQAAVACDVASHADSVIAAHWGDVWLDDMGFIRAEDRDPESHALGKVLKEGRAWLLEHVCRGRLPDPPEQILRESVASELRKFAHLEDEDFRIKAFKTEQWSFRWTAASLRAYQLGLFPRLPFYDTRMTDFLSSVPTEFVRGRRLQIDYLKLHAPDLARITWQAFDTSLFRYPYFDTLLMPGRAFAKLRRTLHGGRVIERNWEVQFLGEDGRRELERNLLSSGLRLHDLVPPAAIRDLLDDFFRDPYNAHGVHGAHGVKPGYSVSMLLTFSLWLERYFR